MTRPSASLVPSLTLDRAVLTSVFVYVLLGLSPSLMAQTSEDVKLLPSLGMTGDSFGSAVTTDGARVAVGAAKADALGQDSGAAYVFDAATGSELMRLVPSNGAAGDHLGASIAMDGARVVVGAPGADGVGPDSGAVYLFDAKTGSELLALQPTVAVAGEQFGYAVAIDGGLVAVGSLGAAYLFDASTGQQLRKFVPSGGSTTLGLSGYGEAIDIDLGRVVVGARLEDGVSGIAGAAYVFDAASGHQLHRLVAPNGTAWAFFGACVSIDDNLIAIGAPEAGPLGKHSGAAYLFDGITGQQVHYLVPTDGHIFAKFGSSVGVDGHDLFIGSEQNHVGAQASSGSVYRYGTASGNQVDKLFASDAQPNDQFGAKIAVAGGVLVSGADRDDDLGDSSGSAYVFDLIPEWSSQGCALYGAHGPPVLVGMGSLAGLDPVSLSLTHALENSLAYLIVGLTAVNSPFLGGTLVPDPAPPGFVFALPTGPAGAIQISSTWPVGVPSGLKLYCQYWIADPAGPAGFSASNAISGTTP